MSHGMYFSTTAVSNIVMYYPKSLLFDQNCPHPEGGEVDTSAGDAVVGYKIGSFYITELCSALTRYAPKLINIILSVLQATDSNVFAVEMRGGYLQ